MQLYLYNKIDFGVVLKKLERKMTGRLSRKLKQFYCMVTFGHSDYFTNLLHLDNKNGTFLNNSRVNEMTLFLHGSGSTTS